MLTIEDLIIVGLVGGIEEAAPNIRQEAKFYIFIFQVDRPVLPFRFSVERLSIKG